ncbi:GDYXXLXY domain-containing protein [Shewanella sp. KT0246]|uniref:GDYXXLXY domain-containing protein n=1 Tax=Shewanella sp. KT0246 TaxID=2815912 RepID=UPI001BC0D6D7|nr:GDYXXLXY domain-containing protein [Shewanella sp. KT0246]GIU50541.1 membrane protein [Shewanella sp. KT0246]
MPKFSKASMMKNLNNIILVGTLVLILGLVNWQIYQKEQHIHHGELIYLELAPVDPRSLMQGDYMALRFQISNDVRTALKQRQADEELARTNKQDNDSSDESEANQQWLQLPNSDGFVIVTVEKGNVGKYKALVNTIGKSKDNDIALADNEMRLQYRVRDGMIKFATNAFFFQEGHASVYEAAKYGEFRVNKQGAVLLTNMFDEDLNKLEPQISLQE